MLYRKDMQRRLYKIMLRILSHYSPESVRGREYVAWCVMIYVKRY